MKISFGYFLLAAFVGANVFADEVIPAPTPAQIQAPSQGQQQAQIQAPVCTKSVNATVYTVTSLYQCGVRVKNSGIRGAINRRHTCGGEVLVGKKIAIEACGTCSTYSHVNDLKCLDCNVCENPEYVGALLADLELPSVQVQWAAVRDLRRCGYSVDIAPTCVQVAVQPLVYK